jgi:hypothetical protein
LGLGEGQRVQIALDAHALGWGDIQAEPPVVLVGCEEAAFRWRQVVPMKYSVQTVLGLRGEPHHFGSMSDQSPVVTNL